MEAFKIFSSYVFLVAIILISMRAKIISYLFSATLVVIGYLLVVLTRVLLLWLSERHLRVLDPIRMSTGLPGTNNYIDTRRVHLPSYNPSGIEYLDSVLEQISLLFMRDFVLHWHDKYYTDKSFPATILHNLHVLISHLCFRLRNVKWSYFCAIKINRILNYHVKLFIKSLHNVDEKSGILKPGDRGNTDSKSQSLKSQVLKSQEILFEFFELESSVDTKISHKSICMDPQKEIEFLTFLVESFLYLLLPEVHFNDKIFRYFIRDVLVTQFFIPLVESICDPDYINRIIHSFRSPACFNNDSFISAIKINFNPLDLHELITALQLEITKLSGNDMNDKESEDVIKKQILSLMFIKSLCSNQLESLKRLKLDNSAVQETCINLQQSELLSLGTGDSNSQLPDKVVEIPFKYLLESNISFPYLADYFQEVGDDHLIFLYFGIKDLFDTYDQLINSEAYLKKSINSSNEQLSALRSEIFNLIQTSQRQFDCKTVKFDYKTYFTSITQEASKTIPIIDTLKQLQIFILNYLQDPNYLKPFYASSKYSKLYSELKDSRGAKVKTPEEKILSPQVSLTDLFHKDFAIDLNVSDHTFCVLDGAKYVSYSLTIIIICNNTQSTWTVHRRYRDFLQLHNNLISKFSFVSNISFPSNKTMGSRLEELIEKRKQTLNQYMKALINHDYFRSNRNYHQIVSNFIDKNVHVYWKNQDVLLHSEINESPIRASTSEIDRDIAQPANLNLDREEIETRAMSILVNLMEELFDLKTKTPWLPRQLKTFFKEVYIAANGDRVIRQIIDEIDEYLNPHKVFEYLTYFKDSYWPGNVWAGFYEPRSDRIKARERVIASSVLIGLIPTELRRYLGEDVALDGIVKFFNMIQIKQLNKRLFYSVFESVIETLFPENSYSEIIKTLADSLQ